MRRVIYSKPDEFAEWFADKLEGVGCSPEYIAAWRVDFYARVESGAIQVRLS
jgi:hypothetical protein